MSSNHRRAEGRRRAWGRGPMILRFEPLEGRALMTTTATVAAPAADVVATSFGTQANLYWGDTVHAAGTIANEGTATASADFKVDVYASASPTIGSDSVLLGSVDVPGGLAAGASTPFKQDFNLPAKPLDGLGSSPSFYITLRVDPANAEGAASTADKQGLGQGVDTSVVTLTPHVPSDLVGAGFVVGPTSTTWGGTVHVSATVQNAGDGDAPATRAEVVATPAGATPGGASDVALGSLSVPALPAHQSIALQADLALPAVAPKALAGASSYTLSLVEDADFQADRVAPHLASRGIGLDSAAIAIGAPTTATIATGSVARPDLSVGSVQAPTTTLVWGRDAQVQATVVNAGAGDAGSFQVRFLLANAADPTSGGAEVLATTTVPGLKAGTSETIAQTVRLPAILNGTTPPSSGQGTILVEVNPDHSLDESDATNNALASSVVKLALVAPATDAAKSASNSTSSTSAAATKAASSTVAMTPSKKSTASTTSTTTAVAQGKRIIVHQAHAAVKATHQAEAAVKTGARRSITTVLKTARANLRLHKS